MLRPTGMTVRRAAFATATVRMGPPALVALALVALASVLLASVATAAEKASGMPQLDFANPLTIAQVVWGAIILGVLYLLLSRWALPQVGAVLEQRANRIQGDLAAAHIAKTSADAAVAELTAAIRQAQGSAQAEVAAAVAAANEAAAIQAATLNARLASQLAAAEQRIAAARASAVGALRDVATDTAAAVVTRLIGTAPSASAVDQAVDAALATRRG